MTRLRLHKDWRVEGRWGEDVDSAKLPNSDKRRSSRMSNDGSHVNLPHSSFQTASQEATWFAKDIPSHLPYPSKRIRRDIHGAYMSFD